jgi:hypothetical protein
MVSDVVPQSRRNLQFRLLEKGIAVGGNEKGPRISTGAFRFSVEK